MLWDTEAQQQPMSAQREGNKALRGVSLRDLPRWSCRPCTPASLKSNLPPTCAGVVHDGGAVADVDQACEAPKIARVFVTQYQPPAHRTVEFERLPRASHMTACASKGPEAHASAEHSEKDR